MTEPNQDTVMEMRAESERDRKHVMTYTAGGALGGVHLRGPGWSCRCGGWAFAAKAMPRRKTGNNRIEALKSYRTHVDEGGDG